MLSKPESRHPNPDEATRVHNVYRRYASEGYDARWLESNPGNALIAEEQRAEQVRLLRDHDCLPNHGTRALDFGCGSGANLEWLCALGGAAANFYGVDIRPEAVAAATARYPHLNFCRAGEAKLPFPESFFDLIQLHVVLSSILDASTRAGVCAELDRILRSGGAVLVYDFRVNNPWNPDVRGVTRAELRALLPGYRFSFRSLTVVPPLSRRLGRFCRALYPLLQTFPFLRTHNLGLGLKLSSSPPAT